MAINDLQALTAPPARAMVASPEIAIVQGWRAELVQHFKAMKGFGQDDPADVFMQLAGMSARASEIRFAVMESSGSQRMNGFRTKQLDPFIEEIDRQFKLWSRWQAVRTMDWEISRGAV